MQRRHLNWAAALVGIALAGVVAVSAVTALAARSATSPFELVFTGRAECHEEEFVCAGLAHLPLAGTFTSGAPFCASGTGEAVAVWRYTCADGSGSLAVAVSGPQRPGEWTIVDGSGRYEGFRGKGTFEHELLEQSPAVIVVRTTFEGVADADAVAPTVSFTSARATKARRLPGAYVIRIAFTLRDDVEGNPVAYRLKVTERRIELASKEGTTASGSASATLAVEPSSKRLRSVDLHLLASDPNGNQELVVRPLKLPR